MVRSRRSTYLLIPTLLLVSACREAPTAVEAANIIVSIVAPSTVRSIAFEISGPGIAGSIVRNAPIVADSIVRDTLSVPTGSGRRFLASAFDTAGVLVYRADTTVTIHPGDNGFLPLRMRAVTGSLGVVVTFGLRAAPVLAAGSGGRPRS